MNNSKPNQRTHPPLTPGQLLTRVVGEVEGKVTQQALADALAVSRFTVSQILNGHRSITPEMAVRLERALGTSAEFWLDAQLRSDLFHARQKLSDVVPGLTQLRERQDNPPV